MIGHPLFNYYVATLEMNERRRLAETMRQARAARRGARRPRHEAAPVRLTEDDLTENRHPAMAG